MGPSLPPAADPAPPPGVARRLTSRFALLAFAAYHLPLVVNDYPSLGGGGTRDYGLAHTWGHVFTRPGLWMAHHVFGWSWPMPEGAEGDNGDTAEEYCRLLLGVVLAAVGAAVWTWIDRRAPRSRWVEPALRLLLRYAIALGLASYAMAKLMPIQFGELAPWSLEPHVGDVPPMRILWTLMEASQPYGIFAGVLEMLTVVLLSFRRTATLGALVGLPVLANVAMLDLCYDVPVKLYSMSLTVSAAALVVLDARRLADVLVLHRAVPAAPPVDLFASPRLAAMRWILKIVLVGGVVLSSYVEYRQLEALQSAAERSPLYGWWTVDSFVRDGRDLVPTADPSRWRRVTASPRGVGLRLEDDSYLRCGADEDPNARTLQLHCRRDHEADLRWSRSADHLTLEGTLDGSPVSVGLTRIDDARIALRSGRFRWIQEE